MRVYTAGIEAPDMRQGILVTGLLALIAVPTIFLADGGSGGGYDQRARPAKTKVDFVKTPSRSTTARGSARRIRITNPERPSGNRAAVGAAVAIAERLAQGAASRYGGAGTDEDRYLARRNVRATDTADSDRLSFATGVPAVGSPVDARGVTPRIQVPRGDGAAARRPASAAEAGSAEVRTGVAVDHRGRDVDRNPAVVARRLRSAAERGDARAQLDLAAMYVEGTGVGRDYAAAFMWYTLAAHSLNSGGARLLVIDRRNRDPAGTSRRRRHAPPLAAEVRRRAGGCPASRRRAGRRVRASAPMKHGSTSSIHAFMHS